MIEVIRPHLGAARIRRSTRAPIGTLSRELHLHANVARTDRRHGALIVRENKQLARIAPNLTKVAVAT